MQQLVTGEVFLKRPHGHRRASSDDTVRFKFAATVEDGRVVDYTLAETDTWETVGGIDGDLRQVQAAVELKLKHNGVTP